MSVIIYNILQMKAEMESLFIGRGDEGFLENYFYELEAEKCEDKLFMCLEILNNDAEAPDIGEAVFENLKQEFYKDLTQNSYDRFEAAIKKVNEVIEDFKHGKASRFIGNLNILVAAFCGNSLHIARAGDAEAYLVRKRYVSVVTEGLAEDEYTDVFTDIASGSPEDGDTVLFSSSRLLRYITKSELGKILTVSKEKTLEDVLLSLQNILITEILGRIVVVALKFVKEGKGAAEGEEKEEEKPKLKFMQKLSPKFLKPHFSKIFKRSSALPISFKTLMRDKVLIILSVVIILLLGGIIWLRRESGQAKQIALQEQKLTHVQELIDEAATKGQFDREKGANLLKKAEEEAFAVLNSKLLRSKASTLLTEIKRQRSLLDNINIIGKPTVFVDLSEKRSAVNALGLNFLKDKMYAFEYNALYEIILDKIQDVLTISDTESVILGTSFPDKEALAFLTKTGKLIEFRDSRFYFMDTADGIWKKGSDLKAYNDKLYILDPDRNQIWRYRRKRDAYDTGEGINLDADLKNAAAFTIDSSIYVAMKDGKMKMLYGGNDKKIPVKDSVFTPLTAPTKLYTDADLNQIFVLEPSKNRVVSFFKDKRQGGDIPSQLLYQTQYVFQGLKSLRDIYVSKDEGKLYVMDENKIYAANLAQ